VNDFLKAVYEEKLPLTEEQLHQVAEMHDLDLHSCEYRVLLLSCRHAVDNLDAFQRYCTDLPRRCQRFCNKYGLRAAITTDYAGKCILLVMDRADEQFIEQHTYSLLSYLDSHHLQDAIIAVGKRVFSLSDLAYSYKTAVNALSYHSLYADDRCFFCEDMQAMLNLSTLLSVVDPDQMLDAFRAGDMDQLRLLVTAYAEKVRALSGNSIEGVHPTSIRRMFVELTVYVLHMASDMGVKVDALLGGIDPYNYLLFEDNATPVIIDWFMDLCGKMRRAIDEQKASKEKTLIQRICAYIDDHLTESTLSLEFVSSAVSITPSYLSKLFHKEMQVGFSKYVVERRLLHAQRLLESTEIPLREIAQLSGFTSANYFGTVFKRQTGLSPNQYREAHKTRTSNN